VSNADEPTLGRRLEIAHFERCERALADAYRRAGRQSAAERHRVHAELLAARVRALGGGALREPPDDDWLNRGGRGVEQLRRAEYEAMATYHDHLSDFDLETVNLVRDVILPEHQELLDALEPASPRLSEV
jgi:hypothetical protein